MLSTIAVLVFTLLASQSSIIKVATAKVVSPNSLAETSWTVDNPCLSSSAEQVIQEDGTKSLSKVGIIVVGIS